jgi:hypothetical protein
MAPSAIPPAEPAVVVIPRRYRGPPDSANGGFACGVVARRLDDAPQVRLHRPPPLDRPLQLRFADAAHVMMLDATALVAEGIAAPPAADDIPAPVEYHVAHRASALYRWRSGHPFPGCFVCGPDRLPGDGLRIFPGPVPGRRVVAAPWIPDASVCDAGGRVQTEVVWAALDCPSWFGLLEYEPGTGVGLLGQLSARILRRPVAGERCVAMGWAAGRDGRKLYAGAALYDGDGILLGSSAAIWIEPKAATGMAAAD